MRRARPHVSRFEYFIHKQNMSVKFIVFVALVLLGSHTESTPSPQAVLQTFSLEEVVPLRPELYPDRLYVQWMSDTEYIYTDPNLGIRKYDADKDTFTTVLDAYDLHNLSSYSVSTYSSDGKYALLMTNIHKVYRYSFVAEYAVYDIENKLIVNISQGPLQTAVWGGNTSLAYVQNNNVYYLADATQPHIITPLTNEGVPGEVYFGVPDWIYEEEVFNAAEALWFSPSKMYLAVASFNDTNVESAVYPVYGNPFDINNQYPKMVRFKYPKAGRANPVVGLRVFKVTDPTSDAWNIPAPVDVVGLDHILGRVDWATDQNLIVLWLNRRQSISILVNCDLVLDKCSIVKEQVEPNGWIQLNEPFFGNNGTQMVNIEPLYVGDQRFMHISRFDFTAFTIDDMSPVNSTVTEILGWNSELDTLYYIVSPAHSPWQRQLWATTGGVVRCISCKEPSCHQVNGMFSPKVSYGIVTCSATSVPPKIFLYSCKDDSFKLLKDNKKLNDKLNRYKLPLTLFNILPLAGDVVAHVKLYLPPDVKKDQKYPLVLRVYAGPGTSRVKDNFDLEYYNTYLSVNRSYIVASIDVRGSDVMGVEALFAVNKALGTVEITDTLDTLKRLVSLYSFIDPARIGVWGWSYGGFVTTMMLIQDTDNLITCGAAVAPVTSWLYYDSIYTERYMDTPQENPVGYQRSDVLLAAEKLRGRRFLLVHGTGDDNVHYQHSLQLSKQLQRADISFEQMSYTDESHSLLGVSRHFYHTLDHFWTECLS